MKKQNKHMQTYTWLEKYSVNVKEIDEQHRRYFELANHLIGLTGKKDISRNELLFHINDLNNYAIYHFATEENIFRYYDYPGAEEHISYHDAYREKMDEFILEAEKESADLRKLMMDIAEFAGSWLINHIMLVDQKYIDFMRRNGIE